MQPRPPRPTRTDTLFPYTTLFRSVPDIGVPGDDWTAFNLGPDAGIALLERANAWLAAQPAREQRRWVRAVQRQRLEFLGMVDFFRSEEHTSELQSLMIISYAVLMFKKET